MTDLATQARDALPVELAPSLREAAERLLAECQPVAGVLRPDTRPRTERAGRGACYVCHKTSGHMGSHHVVPGDDSTVVPVHPRCHRRLHLSGRC